MFSVTITMRYSVYNFPESFLIAKKSFTPQAFTNTLLQEMRDLKLENVEFLYSDCHSSSSADEGQARSGTWMNPSPESYAKSVLQSVGCGHAQVVAYWPHEFLAWVLWILLLVLPRGTLQSLGRRIGL